MWPTEGEERRAGHRSLQTDKAFMPEEEQQRQLEMGDVYRGIISGVVDLDLEQTYKALSGTADPMEVAKTKMEIQANGAAQAMTPPGSVDTANIDPISGFPRADMEPLPTGVTVEQATAIASQVSIQNEIMEQGVEIARVAGEDPTTTIMKSHLHTSRQHQDRPVLRKQVEARVWLVRPLQAEQDAIAATGRRVTSDVEKMISQLEASVLEETPHVRAAPAAAAATTTATTTAAAAAACHGGLYPRDFAPQRHRAGHRAGALPRAAQPGPGHDAGVVPHNPRGHRAPHLFLRHDAGPARD